MEMLRGIVGEQTDGEMKVCDIENVMVKLGGEIRLSEERLERSCEMAVPNVAVEHERSRKMSRDVKRYYNDVTSVTHVLDSEILTSLYDATIQVNEVISDYDKIDERMRCFHILSQVSSHISTLTKHRGEKRYGMASLALSHITDLLDQCQVQADIITSLRREVTVEKESLLDELKRVWDDVVTCKMDELTLRVTDMTDVIRSLSNLGGLERRIQLLFKQIYSNLIVRIFPPYHHQHQLQHKDSGDDAGGGTVMTRVVDSSDGRVSFIIDVNDDDDDDNNDDDIKTKKPGDMVIRDLMHRFEQLDSLIDFIVAHLLPATTMLPSLFRQSVGDAIIDNIFIATLKRAVPDDHKHLAYYERLVRVAMALFDKMSGGYLADGREHLADGREYLADDREADGNDYSLVPTERRIELRQVTADVATLFINRKCEMWLEQAQRLAAQPLHISVNIPPSEAADGDGFYLHHFPAHCEVSTSHIEFMEAFEDALLASFSSLYSTSAQGEGRAGEGQAGEGHEGEGEVTLLPGDEQVYQLLAGARNMLELFLSTSPLLHERSIAELPLVAALSHNSLMYLSHQLLFIPSRLEIKLRHLIPERGHLIPEQGHLIPEQGHLIPEQGHLIPESVRRFLTFTQYADLIPEMRERAVGFLMQHRQEQRKQIIQAVKDLDDLTEDDKIEKVLKGCCHQMKQLFSIWTPILPQHVILPIMGYLINVLIEEFAHFIISKSDISMDEATLYHSLCKTIQDLSSHILEDTIYVYVRCYVRLDEVSLILTSSLEQIVTRWCHGPLSASLTSTEVRKLVRSLFQNTDRRANALAGIR